MADPEHSDLDTLLASIRPDGPTASSASAETM
jgi:hypothetical protein